MINNTWNCSNICVCIPKCNAGSHCTESNQNSYEVPFPSRNLQNTLLMYERCTLDKLSSTFLENTWHEETVQKHTVCGTTTATSECSDWILVVDSRRPCLSLFWIDCSSSSSSFRNPWIFGPNRPPGKR